MTIYESPGQISIEMYVSMCHLSLDTGKYMLVYIKQIPSMLWPIHRIYKLYSLAHCLRTLLIPSNKSQLYVMTFPIWEKYNKYDKYYDFPQLYKHKIPFEQKVLHMYWEIDQSADSLAFSSKLSGSLYFILSSRFVHISTLSPHIKHVI